MTLGSRAEPPKQHSIPGLAVTFVTSSFTDPQSPFVDQHSPVPHAIHALRHEVTLIVPCRTTSPEAVVTLMVRHYFLFICT